MTDKRYSLNIICDTAEEREEIQNRLWNLKYRLYERKTSKALLKLLKLNGTEDCE